MLSVLELGLAESVFLGSDSESSGQPEGIVSIQFNGSLGLLVLEDDLDELVILVEEDVDFVGLVVSVRLDVLEYLDLGLLVLVWELASGLHPLELVGLLLLHRERSAHHWHFGLQTLFGSAFTAIFAHGV